MQENITISRTKPELRSMDYNFLKEEGIRRIQELAGNIWTDYNEHDPGVTLLEAMCYAITDLGYRTSFDMKDLLAPNPEDDVEDHYNFYTARQILLNNPVTITDFRKLLMDVSVLITNSEGEAEKIGIKNAWITLADKAEYDIYVDKDNSKLSYLPPKINSQEPLAIKVLYDVVFEFSDSKTFGDLNSDTLEATYNIFNEANIAYFRGQSVGEVDKLPPYDKHLWERLSSMDQTELENASEQVAGILDTIVKIKVEFPRWDEADIDWENPAIVKAAIKNIELTFFNLPEDLNIIYKLDDDNNILLASGKDGIKGKPVPFIDDITNRINCLVLGHAESLLSIYQDKVRNIREILHSARQTLNAHRNLCEDFNSFNALRVEEILVCSDIEVALNADVAQIEGEIFYLLDNFLSPTVNFYSLNEILEKDFEERKYPEISIDKDKNRLTIFSRLLQPVTRGTVLNLIGFGTVIFEATVLSASENLLNSNHTDIILNEDLSELTITEDGYMFVGRFSEHQLRPVEEVFEGPALKNGFIDNDELSAADRRLSVHASDIINLIMDIEGVKAIRSLQLANIPQDENPDVTSKSVRWCLKLATNLNYVPRISKAKSRITYYRDGLPTQPSSLDSDAIFNAFKEARRPQKLINPTLDLAIPTGEYRQLSEYVSIQEDLPLNYGVGADGVSIDHLTTEEAQLRMAQVKQLKGYLMVFDQLMANYLSQLDRMKDLFSFNPERKPEQTAGDILPEEYNFQVNKTYFSQTLYEAVSDFEPLYTQIDGNDLENTKKSHADDLQTLTEDKSTFIRRRNKFLDHLIARFGEQFSDYALLNTRIDSGSPEAKDLELIEDKQDFLSRYPDLSANRGKAFDYKYPLIWHQENRSGLEKRVAFLSGVDPAEVSHLAFDPKLVKLIKNSDLFDVNIVNDTDIILESQQLLKSENVAKDLVETIILIGLCRPNYKIICRRKNDENQYRIYLSNDGEIIAARPGYLLSREDAEAAIDEMISLLTSEFLENPLSNRKNYALPLNNYFHVSDEDIDIDKDNEIYNVNWKLYAVPFSEDQKDLLLNGVFEGEIESKDIDSPDEIKSSARQKVKEAFWEIIYLGRESCQYTITGDRITIINRTGEEVARGSIAQINKTLSATDTDNDQNVEEKAIGRLSNFFETIFFRQEGLHLVEHLLLRPKINDVWLPVEAEFIRLIPENDSVIPFDLPLEVSAQIRDNVLYIDGDQTEWLQYNRQITLSDGDISETLRIKAFRKDDGITVITVKETIPVTLRKATEVKVSVAIEIRITDIREDSLQLVLEENSQGDRILSGDEITILGARDNRNYGTFTVSESINEGGETVLTLDQFRIEDQLLPIYLPNPENDIIDLEDCDTCKVDNPYSFIAQVVVPGWPGRMDNIDFRGYFERTMRQEAPAHIFLNICWISYAQMETFEYHYKIWLLENLKEFPVKPY
ncbi:MAG: hypothetical protein WBA74_12240, partial [Cyclobacteriaceae bacterium]